ncbi:unnamed protein product [Cladocopium goreaui]|uniref:mRNA (guanine-N(7))-methyltransferase n=1 Tax=Cladocopium goreaui TaxID=2562237 RepID=A0A9P1CN14_9DINO|nr:unnamed protein product [Cladocopium goreaui]
MSCPRPDKLGHPVDGNNMWDPRSPVWLRKSIAGQDWSLHRVMAILNLAVFPRAGDDLTIPEKLRGHVQVAPYKDLVDGLSSSKIRAMLQDPSAEAPPSEALHPVIWARLQEHVKKFGSIAESKDDPAWSRGEEEDTLEALGQGDVWDDPAAHYDAQAPSSSSLEDRQQSPTVRLRNFNSFAKAVLLDQFLTDVLRQAGGEGRSLSVLDLGCGKGGDLKKLMNSGVTHYRGVDVSFASLEVFIQRLQELNTAGPRHGLLGRSKGPLQVTLVHADAFGQRLDLRHNGHAKLEGRHSWFHLVTSQMACHYAFKSQESLEIMLDNVASSLCAGGYFVATVPDPSRIIAAQRAALAQGQPFGRLGNRLFGIEFSEEEWSKVSSASALWEASTAVASDRRAFGVMYTFHLVDAVDSCLEPLVHFPSLKMLAEAKGLELCLAPMPLSQLVLREGKAELGRLRRIYAFAGGISLESAEAKEQREAMEFYMAFAFRKKEAPGLPTCHEVAESLGLSSEQSLPTSPGDIVTNELAANSDRSHGKVCDRSISSTVEFRATGVAVRLGRKLLARLIDVSWPRASRDFLLVKKWMKPCNTAAAQWLNAIEKDTTRQVEEA